MKERLGKQVKEGEYPCSLHYGETPPEVLCPILWCLVQERHKSVGTSPENIPKNGQRDGAPLL